MKNRKPVYSCEYSVCKKPIEGVAEDTAGKAEEAGARGSSENNDSSYDKKNQNSL
ncbi:MAG: hypothetical protein FWD87_00615 [Spirochaetaceae bacterium]|nr:hypothetical protein [Spirochaetaceae bacterium]